METSLKNGGAVVAEFDVVKGSHVYVRTPDGADGFLEWSDVPPEVRDECTQAAARLAAAFEGCARAAEGIIARALVLGAVAQTA